MKTKWMSILGCACLAAGSSAYAFGVNSGNNNNNQAPPSSWPTQQTMQNQGLPPWPQQQGGWPPVGPWGMPPSNSAVMPDVKPKEQEAYSQSLKQPTPWGGGFPRGGIPPYFAPWGGQAGQQPQAGQHGSNPWVQHPFNQPQQNNNSQSRSATGARPNPPQNRQYGYARSYGYQSSRQWQSAPSATNYGTPNYGNQPSKQTSNSQAPGTWNNHKQDGPGYPPPGMGYPDWYPQDRLQPSEQNTGFGGGIPNWPDDPNMGFGGMPGAVNMPSDPKNAQPAWTGDFSSPVPWPSAGTGPAYFERGKDYSKEKKEQKE
jgi:hypothetical protein